MSIITKTAAKKNRYSLLALFRGNKKTVYFLCCQLLGKAQAGPALRRIFENAWSELETGSADLSNGFKPYIIQAIFQYCREQLLEANPEVFSQSEKTLTPPLHLPKPDETGDHTPIYVDYAFARLNIFHRFALLLKLAAGYGSPQIASYFEISEMDANVTINHAEDAVREALQYLKAKAPDCSLQSFEQFRVAAEHLLTHASVPEDLAEPVTEHIAAIAAPPSKKKWFVLGPLLVLIVALIATPIVKSIIKEMNTTYAIIEVETYGTIEVALDEEAAPETVANFIKLSEEGFYNGLSFHRIVPGFMIQGGDPNRNSTGGSGETIKGEFALNGFDNPLSHTRGTISMARSQEMDSGSSQFFIMQYDFPELDGQYAAFGHVTEGMDVVDLICAQPFSSNANGVVAVEQQPTITSITIQRP